MRGKPLLPRGGTTIQHITDTHLDASAAIRQTIIERDMANGNIPISVLLAHSGDLSNEDTSTGLINPTYDADAVAFMNTLAGTRPWRTGIGNHDIWEGLRTGAAAATAFGQVALNQVYDLETCRVIFVNPDSMNYPTTQNEICIPSATQTWLEARLSETALDCLIVCHAPLKNTCLGADHATYWDSSDAGFFVVGANGATDDAPIRTLLGNHPNAVAWISGHVHCDPRTYTGVFTTTTVGSRQIAHINTPSYYYTPPGIDGRDPIWTSFITHFPASDPGGRRIEVRLRNHTSGVWAAYNGNTVTTLVPT